MESTSPTSGTDVNASPSSTPNPYEGVSTPPDGGAVSSVDTPQDQMQTTAQGQGAPQAVPQGQPQGQSQNQPGQDKQPDLSKPQGTPGQSTAPAKPDYSSHPAVQKASLLHTIAQTLAGGPRYRESIDVNTGEMKRDPVALSGKEIGMAIVMEALGGALGGIAQQGPNAEAKAAAAGYQQQFAQKQEIQQRQDTQANADFARHYQVLETNLRLHQNAMTLGRQDLETNQNYVNGFKDVVDMVMKNHPEAISGGVVNESDLSKYHVTKDTAIPYGVTKRLDPKTGQQVTDQYGTPQWDTQYLVVNPDFKSDSLLTDEDRAAAKRLHIPGLSSSNLPQSVPLTMRMYLNYKSRIASAELGEQSLNEYYDYLNKQGSNADASTPTKTPIMRDGGIQTIVDQKADQYGVPRALARAVAMQESGGNPTAQSKKGALGVMQLMPDTAKQLGIDDPLNPEKNIDGGMRYLKQMIDKYDGNVKLALAAYNAGPGNVTDSVPNFKETKNYVDSITKAIGLGDGGDKAAPQYGKIDLGKEIGKNPALLNSIDQFQRYLNASADETGKLHYQKALGALGRDNPQAAAQIAQLYGGNTLMGQYEQSRYIDADRMKKRAENQELLDRQQQERNQKNEENEAAYYDDAKAIAGDANDPGSGDMMALDKLISQRTADRPKVYRLAKQLNPNFNPANAELKLETWKAFNTGKASDQIQSFNTLYGHIGDAFDAINALRDQKYGKVINAPINALKANVAGNAAITRVMAAIQPVKTEFMTFLNNNHALTEHDKTAGDDIMSWNMSLAQLQDNLKQFGMTSAIRLKNTNERFRHVFGTDTPGLIAPDSVYAISKMPEVARVLGNMDVGGTFLGSSDGRGTKGMSLTQALQQQGQGGQQPTQQTEQNKQQPTQSTYTTKDGKLTWNGQAWVPTQAQSQPGQ